MPDTLKRLLIGSGLGLLSALFVWSATSVKWSFLKEVADSYEFQSYDARFRAKSSRDAGLRLQRGDFLEEFIDTVVIVDIDQASIDDLGNYFRWYHDKHGALIDYIRSGQPRAILFDILFDPEPDPSRDTAFVSATYRAGNVYHAIVLSKADTLNFHYPMTAPPEGVHLHTVGAGETLADVAQAYFGDAAAASYLRDLNADLLPSNGRARAGQVVRIPTLLDAASKTLQIPDSIAQHFPSGDRFDLTFIDLFNASKGIGSANFPQDADGIIRRAPLAVNFSSAGQVYPSLTMAAIMDILDVPRDGLEYDLKRQRLRMINRSGQVVRNIPTDPQGRVWVNYRGTYRSFRYISYHWLTSEMLEPENFRGKIVLIGSTLAGLM
ncbi:MAG: CHASE2 domain-containing protein, partial [Candidatus Neomarinimicrobiota bacterium]